jgi:hypothetical protein
MTRRDPLGPLRLCALFAAAALLLLVVRAEAQQSSRTLPPSAPAEPAAQRAPTAASPDLPGARTPDAGSSRISPDAPPAADRARATDAGRGPTEAPSVGAGASGPEPPPLVLVASSPDAGTSPATLGAGAPPDESGPPSEADERAAARAVALDDPEADLPDPIAEEGERTGSAEGEPLPTRAAVANEIAALSDRACFRALQRARVPFERVRASVAGITAPVRVTGALHGVRYIASERREIHELMDCRLAVALVRFSRMLQHLGVVEVRHYSIYRPPGARAAQEQPNQRRHGGGLAIDAAWFLRSDGTRLGVERDFHGRRRRPVCGPEARVPHDAGARLLRTVACDAARRGIFHVVLTPNHNYAHRNHLHLEVARGVDWIYVH